MTKLLVNRVIDLAETQPDKLAVIFKKEQLSYLQLYRKSMAIAKKLSAYGIVPGDRICFSAVSKPEAIAVYLAVQIMGAVAVFLDKNGTPENMSAIYLESGAKILLTDKPMKEYAKNCTLVSLRRIYEEADTDSSGIAAIPARNDEDLAEILFTSGTTGRPKGVMLTYKSVYNIFMNTIQGIQIGTDEVLLLPLPLNHSFALRVLRAALYQGATVVLQNGFTFAKSVEENINAFGCTAMACVPASYEIMKSQMQDAFTPVLSKLRYIEFSAGSLSDRQRREITQLLPNVQVYNTWGSSESGGAVFCNVTACVKAYESGENTKLVTSLGRPLKDKVQVRILALDAPVGSAQQMKGKIEDYFIDSDESHPGRMILKGDMQMAGYWNNPELTNQFLIDGWLLTGDMAYLDETGNVYMLGRADDMINVGGEKVSPLEVESTADQYEQIKECACIGVDDPDKFVGQVPVLFVTAKPGYVEEDLLRVISGKLERYKIPYQIIKLQELPRNKMDKIDRNALKNIWKNQDSLELVNPVIETILSRRSVRKFTEKKIPDDILEMIVQCGYYAPSGHNMQTWQFTVLTEEKDLIKLKESARAAAKAAKVYFYGWENPQAIILVSNDARNHYGCQDASCAAENIMLAAQSYGIGSVWLNPLMTLRNTEPVKCTLDEMGIPEGHIIWASVALGYPLSDVKMLQKKTDVIRWVRGRTAK